VIGDDTLVTAPRRRVRVLCPGGMANCDREVKEKMVTIEQLQDLDPGAADALSTLLASIGGYSEEDRQVLASKGMRGKAVGDLTKALRMDGRTEEDVTAYRHNFSEVAFGGTSSLQWTQAQAHALVLWLGDENGPTWAERIATTVAEIEPIEQKEIEKVEQEQVEPLDGIKTVSATYGRKFNLGNYESLELSMTAWADIHDETTADDVQSELWNWLKNAVKEQALPVIKEWKPAAQRQNRPTQPAKPTATSPPIAPPPIAPIVPPQATNAEGGTYQTETVKVTAPSGKPVVEFWRPGRKYSEIRYQLGGEELLKLCPALADAGWVAAHFDDIGKEYTLPLTIHWTPSPKNAKWQDIVSIEMR